MHDHEEDQMTPEEAAKLFGESVPVEKASDPNDIYAIAARVKNLATHAVNNNLTPTGVALCNSYVHVLKALYDFSETLPEEHREPLKDLLAKNERMPADFIASQPVPVRLPSPQIVIKSDPEADAEIERLLNLLEAARIPKMIPAESPAGFLPKIVNWFTS